MTAVPSPNGTTIEVICDSCGDVATATNAYVHDDDLVWAVLIEVGWAGSPFAAGRHSCPGCATRATDPQTDEPDDEGHAAAAASFRIGWEADVVIVAPTGDIEIQAADELRSVLTAAIGTGRPVVLDLQSVNVVDSVALGVLVRARQSARRQEVPLCLAEPSRFVLAVLHTMRLQHAFPVFSSRSAAVAAVAGTASAHLRKQNDYRQGPCLAASARMGASHV